MRLIYLAGPHDTTDFDTKMSGIYSYAGAIAYFAETADNLYLFSPILYNDCISASSDLRADFDFWAQRNFFMIKKSSAMWVFTLEGWEESYSLSQEIEYAESIGKEILYVSQDGTGYIVHPNRPTPPLPSNN